MSKKKKIFNGGIISNLDNVLSKLEVIEGEKEERNLHNFESVMDAQTDYEFRGEFVPGKDLLITDRQNNFHVADVLKRRRDGKPIKPIAWHRESGMWILTDADQDAVMSGYVCENCLEWQEIPSVRCNSVSGFSCGYEPPLL